MRAAAGRGNDDHGSRPWKRWPDRSSGPGRWWSTRGRESRKGGLTLSPVASSPLFRDFRRLADREGRIRGRTSGLPANTVPRPCHVWIVLISGTIPRLPIPLPDRLLRRPERDPVLWLHPPDARARGLVEDVAVSIAHDAPRR